MNDRGSETTKIIIDNNGAENFGKNIESGETFQIKDILLGRKKLSGAFSYYKLSDLTNTQNVEIVIRNEQEHSISSLPKLMLQRIAEYLRTNPDSNGSFDCASFAHYVNGISYEFPNFFPEKWKITSLKNESEVFPGGTIIISKNDTCTEITHMAISLGGDFSYQSLDQRGG